MWRVDPPGAKLLIGRSETAYLGGLTTPHGVFMGNLESGGPVDALIEFADSSIDAGILVRDTVRHFRIDGDRVRRVAPLALSPRDFVQEWLQNGWEESARWSVSPALREWHRKSGGGEIGGFFGRPTLHCQTPDLWQVALGEYDEAKPSEPGAATYFLVRWTPPYRFTMVDVSDKPWPRCTQPDPEADEWRTLFPDRDWHW